MMRPLGQFLLLGIVLVLGAGLAGCGRDAPRPATTAPAPKAVTPAPKPTGPLAANTTCVTTACHTRYQQSAMVHQPVAVGACFTCHQPDEGGHHYPLARTGNATCTFCHAVAGTKVVQHQVITQQGCTACHDPHAARTKFLLLADSVGATCAKCHVTPMKKHAHEPFAAGQCTVCHQPHQSEYAGLLRNGTGSNHCFSCHADKQKALAELPHVHKASLENCTNCHGPHATDFPHQLKKSANDTCLTCHTKVRDQMAAAKHVHGAVAAGCTTCHDPHAAGQPNELRARMDKVCLTCHEKAVPTVDGKTVPALGPVLASRNLHGPVRSGNCSECHQPHAADQPNLLKKPFTDRFYAGFNINNYTLCFSCHDQQLVLQARTDTLTSFRDGDRNLHFVHVNRADKGRTCKTCHEIHGSDLPKHLATSVPFEGSTWPMPIHYEQSADGGTCTPGCHRELSYHRDQGASMRPATGSVNTPETATPPTTAPATRGAP